MQAKALTCKVAGIGAWGSYFDSWDALTQLFHGGNLPETRNTGPKPSIIPANERRRAPLPVRLAVESAWQATQASGIPPESLTCVFASGLGDTDLTDYMCKTLASEHKALSPTKFHNSVHNAPAGYWTISTKTMSAANSVAGFEESVSLSLLEAMIQCESEGVPMLVTLYDAPVASVLQPILSNQEAFTLSLVLVPMAFDIDGIALTAHVQPEQNKSWPALASQHDYLTTLYTHNPAAKVLCLAEHLAGVSEKRVTLPLSKGTSITITRT